MVQLNRIYTKGGDGGNTALGTGERVPKTHLRIEAYGTVDELNSVVGLAVEGCRDEAQLKRLGRIQDDLLDVGADLCLPGRDEASRRLPQGCVDRLEGWIDELNADLPALNSFVLPGSQPPNGALHLARTVCRRAERRVLALKQVEPDRVNDDVIVYLNRLSDLFFVEARKAAGAAERLWTPGGGAAASDAPADP